MATRCCSVLRDVSVMLATWMGGKTEPQIVDLQPSEIDLRLGTE